MKWNKEAVIIVWVVFLVSNIFFLKSKHTLSEKIEAETLHQCQLKHEAYCDFVDILHDPCFEKSYRSKIKTMHFYPEEYRACLKKESADIMGKP